MRTRAEAAEATAADLPSQLSSKESALKQSQAELREAQQANVQLSGQKSALAAQAAGAACKQQQEVRHSFTSSAFLTSVPAAGASHLDKRPAAVFQDKLSCSTCILISVAAACASRLDIKPAAVFQDEPKLPSRQSIVRPAADP